MRLKKSVQLLLALVLVMSLFLAACSKKEETTSSPTATIAATAAATAAPTTEATETTAPEADQGKKLGNEPLAFSFYGDYDWMVTHPWGADPSTKWVQDNLKVTVTPIQNGGAGVQKLNTMIATNELPDVIMTERSNIDKLRAGGKLVALDPYLDKYPNLKKYAGEATLNLLRSEDGKLYMFPNWYTNTPQGNGGYLINNKIYKELGSPKLETFDDLTSYLKLVKEKKPNIIPLEVDAKGVGILTLATGFEENYANSYINEKAVPRGDKLTSLFLDPTFNATLKYASQLFRDKLITQDAFTQKSDQVYEKIKNGRVAVFVSGDALNRDIEAGSNFLKEKDPEAGYTAIWPIHKDGVAKDKVFPNSYSTLGWNADVITTSAKNPEAIFAYLDWLTGPEGQTVMQYGPKGKYWNDVDADGAPITTAAWGTTPQTEKDKEVLGSFNWAGNTGFVDGTKAKIELALPPAQQQWGTIQQINVMWKTSQDMTLFNNLIPPSDSPEGITWTALGDILDKAIAKAVFAKSDAAVDQVLKEANDVAVNQGYDKLLAYKTIKWQENIKKAKGQ